MSSPLRVLQIGKYFPPDLGGIETVTENISDLLGQLEVRADVLAMGLRASGDIDRDVYSVERIASQFVLGQNKAISLRYLTAVRRASPYYDVGLLHLPNPLAALAALAFWRKPLVLLWHADFSLQRLRAAGDWLDRRLIRRADAVIAPTAIHSSASRLAESMRSKVHVIPYPFMPSSLPADHGSPLTRSVGKFAAGRPVILAVGRLVPYKGLSVLIKASTLLPNGPAWVIVGDGPLRADLEAQIVRDGVDDRVLLTGAVEREDLQRLTGLAVAGCLPSTTEQEMYGMTQVEMMAQGKPMISTKIPRSGVPCVNIHGVTGLIVAPNDPDALASAASLLTTDGALYATLAAGARQVFTEEHDGVRAAARYAALLRAVAATSTS